ncbi:hypothetical protein GYMLUDRAFT_414645 [Collybiopsis luxurians FD-317 M1]|nr:hypothetical protein GYMLUDRAFT_414645 [Collybiopsis luxurians FD-317 M1]
MFGPCAEHVTAHHFLACCRYPLPLFPLLTHCSCLLPIVYKVLLSRLFASFSDNYPLQSTPICSFDFTYSV